MISARANRDSDPRQFRVDPAPRHSVPRVAMDGNGVPQVVQLTPEVVFKKVGLGLPLFFLRLPNGEVPFLLSETLSDASVEEWVTAAARARLGGSGD